MEERYLYFFVGLTAGVLTSGSCVGIFLLAHFTSPARRRALKMRKTEERIRNTFVNMVNKSDLDSMRDFQAIPGSSVDGYGVSLWVFRRSDRLSDKAVLMVSVALNRSEHIQISYGTNYALFRSFGSDPEGERAALREVARILRSLSLPGNESSVA